MANANDTFSVDQSALRHAQREESGDPMEESWTGQRKNLVSVFASVEEKEKQVVAPSKKVAMRVFLRSKPTEQPPSAEIRVLDSEDNDFPTKICTSSKQYEFTAIFPPTCTQEDVYRSTLQSYASGLRLGKSALIFCYGRTNTGKTHTVTGALQDPVQWGLIPRALMDFMPASISYFEIYNEKIYDLLREVKTGESESRVESDHLLRDVSRHSIDNKDSAMHLLRMAHVARRSASNNINARSSRSHAVCRLQLTNTAVLWIIDLAGSEKAASGMRWKESVSINRSLTALNRCFLALKNREPLPYRESKLTRILGQHWKSSSANRTTLIVNLSLDDAESTSQVLEYASVAAKAQSAPAPRDNASRVVYDLNGRRRILQTIQRAVQMLSPRRNTVNTTTAKEENLCPDEPTDEADEVKEVIEVEERSGEKVNNEELEEGSCAISSSAPNDQDRIDDLMDVVQECEDEMSRMRDNHIVELSEVETFYKLQLQQVNEAAKAETSSLKWDIHSRDYQLGLERLEVADMETKYESLLQQAKMEYEKDVGDLKTDVRMKGEQLEDKERTLNELRVQLNDLENKERTLRELRAQLNDCQQELEYERSKARVEVDLLEKENSGQNSTLVVSPECDKGQEQEDTVAALKRPSRQVRCDPTTGKYLRPRGRAPSGALGWDESEGAWRMSIA